VIKTDFPAANLFVPHIQSLKAVFYAQQLPDEATAFYTASLSLAGRYPMSLEWSWVDRGLPCGPTGNTGTDG
jgi:hypothetical protein